MKTIQSLLRGKRVDDAPKDVEEEQPEQESPLEKDADHWDEGAVDEMNPWRAHHGRMMCGAPAPMMAQAFGAGAMPPPMPMVSCAAPVAAPGGGGGMMRKMAAPRARMAAAECMAMPMAMAAPCAAPAPAAGGAIGFKTGGAQDAANFRENIEQGHLPLPSDVTYEGAIKSYFFDTSNGGDGPPCSELFCPTYSLALAPDPLLGGPQQAQQAAQQAQRVQQEEVFLAVGLDSGITDFKRPRLNLVVLLDISGSMQATFNSYYYDFASGQHRELSGEDAQRSKLDVAKEVIKGMLGRLGPEDSVAITLFNTAAASPKRMGRWGSADAAGIRAGLDRLQATGGTNFQAGLDEATAQLRAHPDCTDGDPMTTENRVIVLTDAETNCGDISEQGLLARLKANSADRFYTTIVGVGLDFNTELVEAISKTRGCNYFSVHTPGEFKARLDDEFDYMVAPLVFDLELRVDPASLAGTAASSAPGGASSAGAPGAEPAEKGCAQERGAGPDAQPPAAAAQAGGEEEEGWMRIDGEEAAGGSTAGAAAGEQKAAPAVAGGTAGGWKVLHVYGSPDSEERRLSGGGSIMRVHTLFPSAKTEEGIKGGVVLLRMQPPAGTTLATAPPLRLAARYCDRSGRQYDTLRTVAVPADAAGTAGTTGAAFFQSSGVRKAVAMARLTDALQCWLTEEWAGPAAPANAADSWNASEAASLGGIPPVPAPAPAPMPRPPGGAPVPPPCCLLRIGRPLLPPSPAELGRWERQSRALSVRPEARAAFARLLPFMEGEVASLGDEEMKQEVDLLKKLASGAA